MLLLIVIIIIKTTTTMLTDVNSCYNSWGDVGASVVREIDVNVYRNIITTWDMLL